MGRSKKEFIQNLYVIPRNLRKTSLEPHKTTSLRFTYSKKQKPTFLFYLNNTTTVDKEH